MIRHCPHRLTAALAAAGLLALAGCSKGEQEEPQSEAHKTETTETKEEQPQPQKTATPTETDSTDTGETSIAVANSEPQIKLLEPGAEPRKALRYKLVKGSKETMLMTTEMTIQSSAPGMPSPKIEVPTIVMDMGLEITELLGEDRARYTFEIREVKVEGGSNVQPKMLEVMQKSLDGIKGLKGQALVNSRGINSEVELSTPKGLDPQMKQMLAGTMQNMDQMSSPLPEEPVGKGAKWEIRQQVEQGGVKLDQVTVFEMVELDGDQGTMKVAITQEAGRQDMEVPGAAGATAELLKLESEGNGEIGFDLAQLVPETSTSLTSERSMKVSARGRTQTMTSNMEIAFTIARK